MRKSRAFQFRKMQQSQHDGPRYATTTISVVLFLSVAARLSAEIPTDSFTSGAVDLFQNEAEFEKNSSTLSSAMQAIAEKNAALTEREEIISSYEEKLEDREKQIEAKILELKEAEISLRGTISAAQNSAREDVEKLTLLYEKMKSKEAAAVFELMEPSLAAGFLSNMKQEQASGILAKVSPEKSYAISIYLAGRNAK